MSLKSGYELDSQKRKDRGKMKLVKRKSISLSMVVLSAASIIGCSIGFPVQVNAQTKLTGTASKSTVRSGTKQSYWKRHPKVKSAAVGAGVGTGVGAITGLVTKKGVVRGSAIGATTGAGVGLIQSSKTLKSRPIVKDVLTGTVAGAGIGLAAKKRGKYKTAGKTAATGAAVGLGLGVLKNLTKE